MGAEVGAAEGAFGVLIKTVKTMERMKAVASAVAVGGA
jgi:hypothetical protein